MKGYFKESEKNHFIIYSIFLFVLTGEDWVAKHRDEHNMGQLI